MSNEKPARQGTPNYSAFLGHLYETVVRPFVLSCILNLPIGSKSLSGWSGKVAEAASARCEGELQRAECASLDLTTVAGRDRYVQMLSAQAAALPSAMALYRAMVRCAGRPQHGRVHVRGAGVKTIRKKKQFLNRNDVKWK